jgi:arylsulfatase A-like enzyme
VRVAIAGLIAAVFAALAVAAVEIAAGGSTLGATVVLAILLTVGMIAGLLQGGVLAAALGERRCAQIASAVVGAARAIAEPDDRETERRRVAALLAASIAAVVGLGALVWIAGASVGAARAAPPSAIGAAAAAALAVALIAGLTPALARALGAVLARIPGVTTRNLAIAALVAAAAIAGIYREPLGALINAIDLGPPASIAVFIAVDLAALALLLGTGRGARASAALGRPLIGVWLVAVAIACWAATLGPASHDPAAIRAYREAAPLTGLASRGLARTLDGDGDGYSRFLGDGDCAPDDPRRHPGAREIPGNGIDDDCFDGDLDAAAEPFAPPPPEPRPAALPERPPVFVIICDTLRPDHLGHYGYERPTSPNLDRFAEAAVIFERAYAPAPYTLASVPAILTSRHPTMVSSGLLRKRGKLPADTPSVAALFSQAGYRTEVISDLGGTLTQHDLLRGFTNRKVVHDRVDLVTRHALRIVDDWASGDRAKPLMLAIYWVTPHSPYRRYPGAPEFGDDFADQYDHEIAAFDQNAGELLDRLESLGLLDTSIIAFLSDHGEAFGEHGDYYHGHNLYEENVRVPLVIRAPGVEARTARGGPVSLIDLAPTLLSLAGLDVPPAMRGHDLTGVLYGADLDPDRTVFAESHFTGYGTSRDYQAAVVSGTDKLIENRGSRTFELYNLAADPGEKNDLALERPDKVIELRRALKGFQSYAR